MASDEQQRSQLDIQVGEVISRALAGKYERRHPVGCGSYGQVWLVERVGDRFPCVAKIMQQEKKHRSDAEVACLASCDHFGIVRLIDHFQAESGPIILLEYCDGGDLSKFLKARAPDKVRDLPARLLDESYIGVVFVQLVMTLHHLHTRRMLHRDIKAANVLLRSDGIVKLSDFGFSRQFDGTVSQAVADTFLGTPYYLSPELWQRQKYGKKADIWSLGVVLYEMMALKRPFVSQSMKGLMQSILNGEYDVPAGFSPGLTNVLRATLQVDPTHRPSTAELLQTEIMQHFLTQFLTQIESSIRLTEDQRKAIILQVTDMKANLASTVYSSALEDASATSPQASSDSIFEGAIHIGSARDWKPRYLVLRTSGLIVTRVREDRRSQTLALESITSVSVADSANMEHVFVVALSTGFTVWIRAATLEERDTWIRHIGDTLAAFRAAGGVTTPAAPAAAQPTPPPTA